MRFEYRLVKTIVYGNGDVNLTDLQLAGSDGWEAVSIMAWVDGVPCVLMKRALMGRPKTVKKSTD